MSVIDLLSDERKSQQLKRIYDDHKFPFEVRYHLDEFLTSVPWEGIQNQPQVEQYAKGLFQKLLEKIEEIVSKNDLSPLDKLTLQVSKNKICEQFSHQPLQLVEIMRSCFKQESFLRLSNQRSCDRETSEEDEELLEYKKIEEQLKSREEQIKKNSHVVELEKDKFHSTLDETVPKISDLNDLTLEYHKRHDETENLREKEKNKKELRQLKEKIDQIATIITGQKTRLKEIITNGCQHVKCSLESSWSAIGKYKQQQKHSVCFLGRPPEGAVDTLNTMCEISGKYLMLYIGYIEMVLCDIKRVGFPQDLLRDHFERLLEDMNNLLEKHLQSIFVITRQPQNVIKIVQSKSPHLNMCITLLGGSSLGVAHTLPSVTIRVYDEKKLHQAMATGYATLAGVCKTVENGSDVQMTVKRPKNHMQASLNNIVLRGVERLEKKDKDERVTEYKYGVVCYTVVTVRNKRYAVKVLSLPVVLTSQTSQEGAAKGILVWDAAFSAENRQMYEDPSEVRWEQMRAVLEGMFKETERGLDNAQLDYVKRYILGNGIPREHQTDVLTKERFLRTKVRGCDFTYWMWLYACKNLIKDHVHTEWKDRVIYGFIGRLDAEELLIEKEAGTFILRFRERKLQESQKANKCAYLAVAVVGYDPITGQKKVDHVKDFLTPADIHKYGLACILKAMIDSNTKEPLLQTLYPDRNFIQILQEYLPACGDSSEGYRRTEFMISVVKREPDLGGSDDPLSPLSTAVPSVPPSDITMSPHFSETDLEENLTDLLLNSACLDGEFSTIDLESEALVTDGNQLLTSTILCTPGDVSIPTTVVDMQDDTPSESSPIPPKRRSSRSKSKGQNNPT